MEEEPPNNQIERYEPAPHALQPRPSSLAVSRQTLEMVEAPDLRAYWRVLRKRRWTILTVFFVLFTVVLIATLKQKPLYRATALLEIQKENPNVLTVQELFELETVSYTYLETQYKILKSDTLARRVIEQLRLDTVAEFNPPARTWWSSQKKEAPAAPQTFEVRHGAPGPDPQNQQNVLRRFQGRLDIEPVFRSRLVEVSFESHNRELAAQVVNTLASTYIEQNLEARWDATQKASEWLARELGNVKARLEKSEDELQRYTRQQGLLFLESERGGEENIVNQRLRQLQEELTRAQAARYEKESLYRLVEAGDDSSLPAVFDDTLMQNLTVRLADLKREYAQLTAIFSPDYPRVKQVQNQIDELEAILARERERGVQRIRNEYEAAQRREDLVRRAFEEQQKQASLIGERSVQYNILKREVETNKQLYEGLLQRLKEAGVTAGLKASNIRIVDAAEPPRVPVKPKVLLNLALALVLGLTLGTGAALLQEYLDNTLKTSEDVERFVRVPALALIPSVDSLNHRRGGIYGLSGRGKLLTSGADKPVPPRPEDWYRIDGDPRQFSAFGEAFRSLRTSVLLSTPERPRRSLLVTSAQPREGKTTISANLAISLAQLGQRVLLIEGDMRRPCIHKVFKIQNSAGLVSYLTGQQTWQALVAPTEVPGLDALVCGPVPPNPAELLSSERMRNLIRAAMAHYQFVIVDSPPLLNVADARILATLVEGLVLVVKAGSTPRDLVQRASMHVSDVGANILGIVLNSLDVRAEDYYYWYYRHDYYGSQDETSEKT
ncbi:MAG: GumC family protein [Terriglobia bacterium]